MNHFIRAFSILTVISQILSCPYIHNKDRKTDNTPPCHSKNEGKLLYYIYVFKKTDPNHKIVILNKYM